MSFRAGDTLWLAPGAKPNLPVKTPQPIEVKGASKVEIQRDGDIDLANKDYFVVGVEGFKLYGWVGEQYLTAVDTP